MSRGQRQSPPDAARAFVTPEGVDLRLRVGEAGARASAFLIDIAILGGLLIALSLLALGAAWASRLRGLEMVGVVWILGAFLLRNFYFIGFELRPGAATPGKRAMGLRVIARDGGRLTADAVFARNAMRELEVFLPATFLFARGSGVDGWLVLLGATWSSVFLLFPLFNRDRLRLGDLAAGTLVIQAPKKKLPPDLSASPAGDLVFTRAQLDAYGVKELHVLEDVLRLGDRRTMAAVSQRIRNKIGWTAPLEGADQAFLAAYYAGLRGRLESRLLFGHRRKDKFDKA
ncbi:RDD family protein [Phenylobacterium sp.]|uniref:RDD family protein n=1 Tax=Phenylobacterium sp. TaxID=1871053 RepID=UPI002F3EF947